MNKSSIEGDDFIVTDKFLSDESSEENEKEPLEKNISGVKNTNIYKSKKSKLQNVFSNIYDTNNTLNEKPQKIIKNISDYIGKDINSNNLNISNETGNCFNFEDHLFGNNNLNNEKEEKKKKKKANKVWYDSDDELYETNFENYEQNENFVIENEENLIENEEENQNIFEKYIEKVKIEIFQENENNSVSNMQTDDIYIFDDKEINMQIQKRRKRNKTSENNIFLKYYLQQFTINQIDEKKIKQIVTLPKSNLILPVYNLNLYMLQYKDKQLNIQKKISFNRKIKYVEEFNGNLYILSFDNFIRNYNIEKGIVYKNRIHYDKLTISLPKEIKFFDNNNTGDIDNCNSNLFSISFSKSGKINLYDKRSFDIIKTFEMDHNYIGMHFHQKSNSLFALDEKGYLYNWCLNTNKLVNKLMDNYSVFPSFLNIHDDYLVTCSFNGFLNLFNINNLKKPIKSFKNLTLRINNAIFNPSHNCLLYYTNSLKNGIKLIDLKTNYIYCNIPWFNSNIKYNIYAANFFNNGNNLCFAVKPNSFYVYDIFNED
ncbi:conserved Plasmodium protein, unknown function [Plasmodium gallinaceum]|uniref:WD repeat-containing protein n=1 Tax=Plasmodium gallinaceum TaxID=5849 RepID=A0A1J1GMG3_PLAGA|nr:conserved Plasmodium protein, unknown function [Plasmodium gallinaceum]CRG93548.1 conserved Plasmodium protein, unknown function [Plasmodium gallinaceum]